MGKRIYTNEEIMSLAGEAKSQGVSLKAICLQKGINYSTACSRLARMKSKEEVRIIPLGKGEDKIEVVAVKLKLAGIDELAKLIGSL